MDLPDHDNAMKWLKTLSQQSWSRRLLIIIVLLLIVISAWWFRRLSSSANKVVKVELNQKIDGDANRPVTVFGDNNQIYQYGSDPQKELNELKNKVNENTFRPFKDELRAKVKANLKELAQRYAGVPIKINVGYQTGDPNKESIALDIVEVIKASGLEANKISVSMMGRSSGKLPPMQILANPQHAQSVQIVNSFLNAIQPLLRGRIEAQRGDNLRNGEIEIRLLGIARFLPGGEVLIE